MKLQKSNEGNVPSIIHSWYVFPEWIIFCTYSVHSSWSRNVLKCTFDYFNLKKIEILKLHAVGKRIRFLKTRSFKVHFKIMLWNWYWLINHTDMKFKLAYKKWNILLISLMWWVVPLTNLCKYSRDHDLIGNEVHVLVSLYKGVYWHTSTF